MENLKDYRFIKNKALIQAIDAKQTQKMKDDGLNNIEITGSKISFEIDIQNLGIINTYSAIFCNNIEYYGDAIVPIYIPNVHDIKEIMNDLLTDKSFEYKFISPYIKIKSMERKGFNRYISTNSLVHSLRSHINIDEDDCIYNVAPLKELPSGIYVIHEANENGEIIKTLFDTTYFYKPKLVKSNKPKKGILNLIESILTYPFNGKYRNGYSYNKL